MKQDVLEKAAEIDERANKIDTDVGKSIDALTKGYRNTRIFLIVQLVLIIGFGFVLYQSLSNKNDIARNRDIIKASCESTNDSRANNRLLWEYIQVRIDKIPATTPEEAKERTDFKNFVKQTFEPRNCSKVVEN